MPLGDQESHDWFELSRLAQCLVLVGMTILRDLLFDFDILGAGKVALVFHNSSVLDNCGVLDDPLGNNLALHLFSVVLTLSLLTNLLRGLRENTGSFIVQ